MRDHAPKTMMSPGPRRGRGPLFFVVLFLVGIFSIAAGAVVVLFFVIRKGDRAPIVAVDAASPQPSVASIASSAASPVTLSDAGATPIAVSAHSPSIHPGAVHASSLPGVTLPAGGCMCRASSGDTMSLCPKERLGPSMCSCEAVPRGTTLCPIPWKEKDGCPTSRTFGGTLTAKNGDACSGFNGGTQSDGGLTNEKLTGVLKSCWPCATNDAYAGKMGTPCVGYRNERTPVDGVVDCSNLEFDCKRGDAKACAQLASHK